MVIPSSSRAVSSSGIDSDAAASSANTAYPPATSIIDFLRPIALASTPPDSAPQICPITTVVVSSSCWWMVSWKSSVMNSSAPAMLDRS